MDDLAVHCIVAAKRGGPRHLAHVPQRASHGLQAIDHRVQAKRLHGSLVQVMGLGQDRRARVAFEQAMRNAIVRQEGRE